MPDVASGLGNEPAAPKDLDTILSGAIDAHTITDDAAVSSPAASSSPAAGARPPSDAAGEAPQDPKADASGRLHGQDGKFVADPSKPKVGDNNSAAKVPPGSADAAAAAPTLGPDPVVTPQPIEPPARWTADNKAKFATWPRDVQEIVLERVRETEADYTRKTQEAAELRRSAEPILNAVKPFEAYLSQIAPAVGQTPDQMIGSLLGVEYQLRTGDPYQKVQALAQIAASYGIDLAALSRGEMPAAPDPHYQQLRQAYGSLGQEVSQLRALMDQEQQRQTYQQIEAFASAKDDAGRPKHPHFERVRGVMGQLLRADETMTLDAAYQKAIEPIQAAIADELRTRQEAAERQRLDAIEKAKKAAPVKSSGSQPSGSAQAKDLDSLLWDQINAKLA